MMPSAILIELDGFCIVCKNVHVTFEAAFGLQARFHFFEEYCANTLSAIFFMDRKVIDRAAAAIIPSDDCTDNHVIYFSDQKQFWVALEFFPDFLSGI